MAGQDDSPASRATPLTRQTAFTSADTHPLVLDRLLGDKYGVNWLVWEPETLWATITKDFALKSGISNHARSGIQVVKTLHAVDSFFLDWQVTNWVTQGLDGVPPDFEVLQEASPGQIIHAVTCAKRLRGDMPYDDEVQSWMAACFLQHGLVYALPPVEFIQDEIANTEAKCKKCDNVEWATGLTECPNCGAEKDQLEISPKYAWQDIREMWQIVKNADAENVVLREDRIGVQMARLFVARDHMREQMARLDGQLKELDYGGAGRP